MAIIGLKTLGLIVSAVGAGAAIASSVIDDKKMEQTIEEKVDEALTKREESEES